MRGFRRHGQKKPKPVTTDGYKFATEGESTRYLALKARASYIEYLGAGSGLLVFRFRLDRTSPLSTEAFKGWQPGKNKFGAKKKTVDGIKFDSTLEAHHYVRLKGRLQRGEIADLRMQQPWPLIVAGNNVCTFKSDFEYVVVATGEAPVVDVKGFQTRDSRTKHKLFRAVNGFDIEVVTQ